ncbi:DUF4906 domain-containing protein [Bacteroides sp.]
MKRRNTFLLACVLLCTACQDDITNQPSPSPEEGTVQVPLTISFEQEADGYAMPTRATTPNEEPGKSAFDAQLTPQAQTRSADLQPDALYELHIMQYETNGNLIGSVQYTAGATPLGQKQIVTLSPREECQLVIVARGKGNTSPGISGNLANIQTLNVPQSVFDAIPTTGATQEQINKMPYVLHLKSVKVIADAANAGKGIIQSTENGTNDVRLRLKRLATKLTLNWTINPDLVSKKYTLKEVRLCQVPKLYNILPKPEETQWGLTYPSAVAEFVDVYRLTDTELTTANNTRTVWIPANVRGTSSAATAPIHRTKENAPIAASYAELVVDNSEKKERLYYRAYLGGIEPTDFNLRENTDYNWNININTVNYTDDPRIQLLDQTPVQSENLVPTANCLMLQPGGNLCFNPYKHTSGTNGWNDHLVTDPSGTPTITTIIDHVKILWQMKDNGTSGDLVMGYVIDENNHVNLANVTDASNTNNARVHVKAPVSNGGNAVVAAYDVSGTILWSWHLWITNYVPKTMDASTNYVAAQQASRNGTVHQYANTTFTSTTGLYYGKVVMDRNIGATAGGFPGADASQIEFSKRGGLFYQWGRKDPSFASIDGTANEKNVIYDGFANPVEFDKPAYDASMLESGNTLLYSIRHPLSYIRHGNSWYNGSLNSAYSGLWGKNKTIYDPCPDGWQTSHHSIWTNVTTNYGYWFNSNSSFVATGAGHTKGGRLYNLSGGTGLPQTQTIHNTCWFPANGFRSGSSGNIGFPNNGYLVGYTLDGKYTYYYLRIAGDALDTRSGGNGLPSDSEAIRCVQQ